ncbi:fasciclin domain-containing protein, partial [Dolichospermum sp. ST_sed7]|nr:fasciclin domain-containing protein [Dolichospermum sp. ST_sed7]
MADIVDTAVKAGSFSTLIAAVKAAGLVDTLKGDGPFTLFAPTDEGYTNNVVNQGQTTSIAY